MDPRPVQRHVESLRDHRNRPDRDLSLGYLAKQFQRDVAKPHKQLADLVGLWAELVPPELAAHTRLLGLARGVLRVAVDSTARNYELDRLLRGGLERELVTRHKGAAMRKIKLIVEGDPRNRNV